jgi:hypothetical protein
MSNALHVPFDAATARTAEGRCSPAYPRLVLATTILASSLAFIDGSVVNVGLPAIGRSFHADAIGLQWIVNAYLLPLSALLLLGGAAGDRFGRRRLLIVGVLLFGIASGLKSRECQFDLFQVRVIPPTGLSLPLSTQADRDVLANVHLAPTPDVPITTRMIHLGHSASHRGDQSVRCRSHPTSRVVEIGVVSLQGRVTASTSPGFPPD